jgi:DNA invertase Pin-like site-specific DNA recombinase
MENFVVYLRVSTTKQGIDGLGIEAQESAIRAHGGNVIGAYKEVETGKKSDRPELAKALAHCKRTDATLLIAKLDRLARNVHFVTSLQRSGVKFVCCDMPNADTTHVQLMAVFAEHEARCISDRTKKALAEKRRWYRENEEMLKEKGERYRLGNMNLDSEGRAKGSVEGNQKIVELAAAFANRVAPTIKALQGQGMSLRGVAKELEKLGVKTARGGKWTPTAVINVLAR